MVQANPNHYLYQRVDQDPAWVGCFQLLTQQRKVGQHQFATLDTLCSRHLLFLW
jgi:hypothetical protein